MKIVVLLYYLLLYEGYCYPFAEAKLFNKTVVAYDMPIFEMLQSEMTCL